MRGNKNFYHANTMMKMTVAILNEFSDIVVQKYDKIGNVVESIDVPIIFGTQKSLHVARTNEEQQKYVPTYPRIEIRLLGMTFDDSRLVSPNTRRYFNEKDINWKNEGELEEMISELNDSYSDFMPLPYNYNYKVNVFTESMTYLSQIIENIFPYFALSNSTMRIREFDHLNIERDINCVIGSPELDLASESLTPTDKRQSNCNFSMQLEGWMYRPIERAKLVKTLNWHLRDNQDNILDGGQANETTKLD
jgi:hypothetical protein